MIHPLVAAARTSRTGLHPLWFAVLAGVSLSACSTAVPLNLGPKPRGVSVEAQMNYYDVSAADLADLRAAMVQQGPRVGGRAWSAATWWRLHWTWEYDNRGTTCALRNVRVRLRTTIDFPRWTPTAQPDSALLEWWHQMSAGLAEHERGHAQIAMQAGGRIVEALDGMMGARCAVLGEQANFTAQRITREAQAQQAEYDRTTRHGATQIQLARRLRDP